MQSLTKQLGDSRGLIIRLLVAYKVILQAIDEGIFDELSIDENGIEFSHLYTLINNPESRNFIGLGRAPLSEGLIVNNPVPPASLGNLKELMAWLYGVKSVIKSQGVDRRGFRGFSRTTPAFKSFVYQVVLHLLPLLLACRMRTGLSLLLKWQRSRRKLQQRLLSLQMNWTKNQLNKRG